MAIERLTGAERMAYASWAAMNEYNMLLDRIIDCNATLVPYLPPKAFIQIGSESGRNSTFDSPYRILDLFIWTYELIELLGHSTDAPAGC